jgi:hypothetical protein
MAHLSATLLRVTGDGPLGAHRSLSGDWQSFVDALQILVLVAGAAARTLEPDAPSDICRELVAAATRVLDLVPGVVPGPPSKTRP